ncbi:TRAP transporter substrate-binding protein [Billgrantia endophytica]|uniref:ABC transporter substrate-binding protein n=1 Tax=Billgrantia endophytica TaxID=2033802 RepID=A0A2N7TW79_9GAMM|nr:TRAP transporter substrate-binding protein [Halomonas endophytica]PMR72443.1 ABC transporter substrate-binding protein [Halomonas endophytica]
MMKRTVLAAMTTALMASAAQAETLSLKVLGQPAGSGLIAQQKEQPFFEALAEHTGLDVTAQYIPVDVAGIPDTDGLRVLRSGLFDIVSLRGPQVSRDEPSILGLDLIGLNTSFAAGRENVSAFYDYVDSRLQERFNAKLLGVWPAGPQVIFCSEEIGGLSDLQGLRVRVGDQSAANFVGGLGATGISMPFGDVQQALARGVVDCAITGPASANSGGWPEAATTVLPIALQLAINGYAINLDTWNRLSTEQQAQLESAIATLSDDIWEYSESLYEDAMRCNAGESPCEFGTLYSLTEVPVAEADLETVAAAVEEISLPTWARQCNDVAADCEAAWRESVGQQLGL